MNLNHDTFYDIKELTLSERKKIMKYAKDNSFEWWVDELDCSKSFIRQRIEISFEVVIKKYKIGSHFVIINRHNEYGEIGFTTFTEPSYFLWINISIENLEEIIKKFNLKKR